MFSVTAQNPNLALKVRLSSVYVAVRDEGCVSWDGDNGESIDSRTGAHISEPGLRRHGFDNDDTGDYAHALLGERR